MIKRVFVCIFITLAVTFSGFADKITVTGNAPTFTAIDPEVEDYIDDFNEFAAQVFEEMLGEIQGMVETAIPSGFINSSNLLNGLGTSSVFSSHGATMRAYADYKFMSISIGTLLGLKLPEGFTDTLISGLSGGAMDIGGLISENTVFGVNPQFFSLHVGFNPSALIEIFPKNLSLGIRLGFFGLPNVPLRISNEATASLNFNTFTIGLTANYQLIPAIDLAKVIKWRGVSVGSGLIFQTTKLDLFVPFDPIENPINDAGGQLVDLMLVIDPRARLNMTINTFTIPIEVMTSIKLLFLNIPFGIGFDIGFGQSSLSAGAEAGIYVENRDGATIDLIKQDRAGSLSIGIRSNDIAPSAFNFKIMTGLGFTFGDKFMIDIPITFYIRDGFNLGFTLGVQF